MNVLKKSLNLLWHFKHILYRLHLNKTCFITFDLNSNQKLLIKSSSQARFAYRLNNIRLCCKIHVGGRQYIHYVAPRILEKLKLKLFKVYLSVLGIFGMTNCRNKQHRWLSVAEPNLIAHDKNIRYNRVGIK